MSNFYQNLGSRIKKIRTELDLSQEDLAKRLGISRVSLSQIENGDRKLTVEEVTKLARIFNVDVSTLLGLKAGIKVFLEKAEGKREEAVPEMRISVPQENVEKFTETLLYILNKVGSKPNIGETVIYKLLYFIDFNYYEKYEEQLIGAKYIKNHYGPTPVEFKKIVDSLNGRALIKVKDQYFKYPQTKYLPLRPANLSKFKANEIKMIDEVLERLSDMNANEISEYSHKDVPWEVTKDNQPIDYETVFYRSPEYSVRKHKDL